MTKSSATVRLYLEVYIIMSTQHEGLSHYGLAILRLMHTFQKSAIELRKKDQ